MDKLTFLNQIDTMTGPSIRRFYMPGHKGRGLSKIVLPKMDITEVEGADNLHHPQGVIAALQERMVADYKTRASWPLVGGSTLGIQAALLALAQEGDKILVPTNAHRSVYGGLALARAEGIYLPPAMDRSWGLATHVSLEILDQALTRHPEAVGMVLTNPTYYGTTSDVAAIAERLHQKGKWLLVDEAHGAHLAYCRTLPEDALSAGADMVVQSAHKTLAAYTQTGMLHLGTDRVDPERVQRILGILETSSPSYPLMLSIEGALGQAQISGGRMMEDIAAAWDRAVLTFDAEDNIRLYTPDNGYPYDKSKWLFTVVDGSGHALEKDLREKYGIWLEFATAHTLLAYTGMGTTREDLGALLEAIGAMNRKVSQDPQDHSARPSSEASGLWAVDHPLVVPLWQAMLGQTEWVPLEQGAHRISGDFITPYPPGIPVVLPGERMTPEMVGKIQKALDQGEEMMGIGLKDRVAVLCEKETD
ncbi:aminotransferase class I/II-fold pyridoxal phosphate-dependent enzyme [Eubacterium aggregans]|uniref:aminotransferase class I/II-fold pyridoxal phosphate-dependent enzyme n=1 Tax=Eubacterium aggregans TaxID=81409 RepID=UPI0023F382AD|nr:aminotransferase class I/II-fold pyridoxal phosphate-dependent enzyme [Eubacterium aggregans]MDD4691669.1 aminotransferase class V-fold PLP-dependent enzyme [Eubacterium aggregans]